MRFPGAGAASAERHLTESRLQENMSAAYVELSDADYKKLDEILKEHTVIGARYSEATESMTDRS